MVVILGFVVMGLGYILRKKVIEDLNFSRTFECGFVTYLKNIIPFRLRFFLVAIIFLIFDVELILLFPFFFLILIFLEELYLLYFYLFYPEVYFMSGIKRYLIEPNLV